ncbi:MAG: mechanosensitive ion channel family protein [Planctomycetota bacterium]|nr:mechanosensitive ion channel family protein [bacterium]MBU1652913.1 mechanosensitive ion channel family protein [bacterium]
MAIFLESMKHEWETLVGLSPRIIAALFMLILSIIVGRIVAKGISHLISKRNLKTSYVSFFRKITVWLFVGLGLIIALNVMGFKTLAASFVAGGGITAVVLGFAFREIGENLVAGVLLAFSRPFEEGDLIQSNEFQGIVKGIEVRSTHIRTVDGRDIFIPSSIIYKNPLTNFTRDGLRRVTFSVGIDYADDSEKARQYLLAEVQQIGGVLKDPSPMVTMGELAAQYVSLNVNYWVNDFDQTNNTIVVRNDVMEACRRRLLIEKYTVSSNVTTNIVINNAP